MRWRSLRGFAGRFGSSTKPNRKPEGFIFDNSAALEAFLKGPIVARPKAHPAVREVQIKQFDAWEELTKVTRGPIEPD